MKTTDTHKYISDRDQSSDMDRIHFIIYLLLLLLLPTPPNTHTQSSLLTSVRALELHPARGKRAGAMKAVMAAGNKAANKKNRRAI